MTTFHSKDLLEKKSTFITVSEVATLFEVATPTVYRWIKTGKLPTPIDLGGIRWDKNILQEWLNEKYGNNVFRVAS